MHTSELAAIAGVFLLAGFVKGMIGLGLPTVAIGLLGLYMTPPEAAAILVLPSLVTNVWQSVIGGKFFVLLRRLWSLFAAIFVGTLIGTALLGNIANDWGAVALGVCLVIYAALGLGKIQFSVPPRAEAWLAPLIGFCNGVVALATGVFTIPALPYVNGLHLSRDELVQALGMLFTFSTIALAGALVHNGVLHASAAGLSVLGLVASLIGMALGQVVRGRVRPELFRLIFLVGLLLLGAHLALRNVF